MKSRPLLGTVRIAGVRVEVHRSVAAFAVVLVAVASPVLQRWTASSPAACVAAAALMALLLFASVLAHEFGHVAAAAAVGARTRCIRLTAFGGSAQVESPQRSAAAALTVAVSGPAVSALSGLGFLAAHLVAAALGAPRLIVALALALAVVNLVVAVANLVPACPLDGARAVAALMWAQCGDRRVGELRAALGGCWVGGGAAAYGIVGIAAGRASYLWVLVGVFMSSSAWGEYVRARADLLAQDHEVTAVTAPLGPTLAAGVTVRGARAMVGDTGAWPRLAGAAWVIDPARLDALERARLGDLPAAVAATPVGPQVRSTLGLWKFVETGVPKAGPPAGVVDDSGDLIGVVDPTMVASVLRIRAPRYPVGPAYEGGPG